jgi:FMN-dependent NADH-azoreductase
MAQLLHIDSSVRGDVSVSRRLGVRAAERWLATHPGGTVTYRDLAVAPIPHVDAATFTARLVPAGQRMPAQEEAVARIVGMVEEVNNADAVLLGLPLYNFGAPSTVKAWVDHIVAPGLSIDPESGAGLLGGTDFIVLGSRGTDSVRALRTKGGTTRAGCRTPCRGPGCSRGSSPQSSRWPMWIRRCRPQVTGRGKPGSSPAGHRSVVDRLRYRGVALILGASLRPSKLPRVNGGEPGTVGRHRSDATTCPATAMVAGCGGVADRRGLLFAGRHAPDSR